MGRTAQPSATTWLTGVAKDEEEENDEEYANPPPLVATHLVEVAKDVNYRKDLDSDNDIYEIDKMVDGANTTYDEKRMQNFVARLAKTINILRAQRADLQAQLSSAKLTSTNIEPVATVATESPTRINNEELTAELSAMNIDVDENAPREHGCPWRVGAPCLPPTSPSRRGSDAEAPVRRSGIPVGRRFLEALEVEKEEEESAAAVREEWHDARMRELEGVEEEEGSKAEREGEDEYEEGEGGEGEDDEMRDAVATDDPHAEAGWGNFSSERSSEGIDVMDSADTKEEERRDAEREQEEMEL
ncbi:uncharacterized protein EV422DRAFT_570915 [Fimicolochytrium jonesii]|uniref:uncharacterized protein n=1 Tax=Fimicolochytrium jonesii TaxID=1396493 RepID=UPI0022FECB18|nr:uncharacterized protein EV422DRAFT_570915 [Fimicolochytrium jonesii]KAI8817292.1 hypothetical protein EV422DRAFT_570915 [Fimicolochytrium jonesii]